MTNLQKGNVIINLYWLIIKKIYNDMDHVTVDSGSVEMDTDILFEKFTIEEVKEIEKKTR